MRSVVVAVPPTWEPVTTAEARAHCRIDTTDDDTLLSGLIKAAREHVELITWSSISQQTIDLWLDGWPSGGVIELPRSPIISVTYVKYYDADDREYTLDSSVYYANTIARPGQARLKYDQSWPTTTLREYNAVNVRYEAGYTAAANVPQAIKQAILMLVGHWYENREAMLIGASSEQLDFAVKALVNASRLFKF
mgnify:CR=1 FL=1|jgi:uncharacterized phiE125 gp8 family phage protein